MFTNCEQCPSMIDTVDALIDALGGNAAVAALTGRRSSAVSNWRKRGRVPAELSRVLESALGEKGRQVAPSLFGMAEAEAR